MGARSLTFLLVQSYLYSEVKRNTALVHALKALIYTATTQVY